jgi:hypothetical protein
MDKLNGCEPRKIEVKGPYTFTIGDTRGLGDYKSGGWFHQVKMPEKLEFVSLKFYMNLLVVKTYGFRNLSRNPSNLLKFFPPISVNLIDLLSFKSLFKLSRNSSLSKTLFQDHATFRMRKKSWR